MNPIFLLVHRNRYLEKTDNEQMTPSGYPTFYSYVKNLCYLVVQTDRWMDRWTDGRMERLIRGGLCNLIGSSRYRIDTHADKYN
jgi:hypothetical protein